MKETISDACEQEIRSLHGFFADWYTGRLDEEGFDRFEDALAVGFEMVTPDGELLTRDEILDYVRGKRDTHDRFDIEIRNVEAVEVRRGCAFVRYEEWQTTDGDAGERNSTAETDGRLSTALFGTDDAPEKVEWLYLHETRL